MQHRPQVLEANLANLLIQELAKDETAPHARVSAPYEKVELVELPAADLRQTRRRAATIPREDLAARRAADSFDAACTLRFSTPYERIEIGDTVMPRAALVSGTFEAAWFVAADDMPAEPVAAADPDQSAQWLWILSAAMFCAFAVAVIALI